MSHPGKAPFPLLPKGWHVPKEGAPVSVAWKEKAVAELIFNSGRIEP